MIDLDVFGFEFLKITELSEGQKLAPAIGPVLGRVLFIGEFLQRLHFCIVCWVKKEGNRKPFLL